jgi:hypothetical protein
MSASTELWNLSEFPKISTYITLFISSLIRLTKLKGTPNEINGKQKQKTKTSEYGGETIPKVGSLWNFSELPNISTTDNIFNLSISLLRNYTKI